MKIRKELWFGFVLMALIVAAAIGMLLSVEKVTNGHIGLLMLSLVVVAIMLGFPTAFTLMGMGMLFTWLAYDRDWHRTLDLMVQSAFKVMGNDVLIAVPLFVFMTACGFTFPCVQVLALDRHGKAAGTAASLLGATNFGVAAVISPVVGLISAGSGITATTMASVMVGCAVIGCLSLWLIVRPRTVERLAP